MPLAYGMPAVTTARRGRSMRSRIEATSAGAPGCGTGSNLRSHACRSQATSRGCASISGPRFVCEMAALTVANQAPPSIGRDDDRSRRAVMGSESRPTGARRVENSADERTNQVRMTYHLCPISSCASRSASRSATGGSKGTAGRTRNQPLLQPLASYQIGRAGGCRRRPQRQAQVRRRIRPQSTCCRPRPLRA